MRRAICFMLVLAFCLSLSCTAFAAPVSSAADSGTPSRVPSYSGSNPKTGDMIMRWVIIMVLALVALIAVAVCYRKFAR